MFKSLGNLIHRTSWLTLIGGGLFVLIGLILFAAPIHLLRLPESGRTPAEKSAIKREINLAFGDRALTIAESVVRSMKSRSADPDRVRELDSALAEMERARREIERARSDVGRALASGGIARRESATAARAAAAAVAESALSTATTSAEAAVEAAADAREGIEQARDNAIEKLREKGVETASTKRAFDELLRSARDNEKNARQSLAAIKALPRPAPVIEPPHPPEAPESSPTPHKSATSGSTDDAPPKSSSRRGRTVVIDDSIVVKPKGMSIHIGSMDPPSSVVLPPEMRLDIRNKVAGDVWRVGIGSGLILIYIPMFMMLLIAKFLIGRSRRALEFAEEKKQEEERRKQEQQKPPGE